MPKGTPGRLPCSVDGCERRSKARGWCSMHYQREKAAGLAPLRASTIAERFWEKVDFVDGPVPAYAPELGPCWLWIGSQNGWGYGQFRVESTRLIQAHAWAWIEANGPVPDGLELDHLCRVRNCVRPAHLEPVTHRINSLRGQSIAATNAAKTHCPQGHVYDEANTVVRRGSRECRICVRACHRRRHARQVKDRSGTMVP